MKFSSKKAGLLVLATLSFGVVSATHAEVTLSEVTQEVEAFQYYKQSVEYKYHPKTEDQILLPNDIGSMPVVAGLVVDSEKTLPNLHKWSAKKLQQYLEQNQQAGDLFKKYQKRLAAVSNGMPLRDGTLEKVLNEEALYKFLDIQVTPSTISPELLAYLDLRMSNSDIQTLLKWSNRYKASPELPATVGTAIATEQNLQLNRK